MTMTARISDFLSFLGTQRGAPPSPFETWAAFRSAVEGLDLTALDDVLAQTEQAFVLDAPAPNDTDYASWSESKRVRRNAAAMRALNQVGSAGASLEQIRLIQAYTGFGGIREIGLLSNDYPPEYVQASRDQIEIGQVSGILPEASAEIIGRVRDQYFTGLDVCTAVHSLLLRTNPTAGDYLESSAGVGRFLRTAPAGKTWTAVELDAVLARMVSVCHRSATVHRGYFEEFAPSLRNQFDVVVGNPPYGKRLPHAAQKHLGTVEDAVSYFFLAGAACLRPGGTLAYLVPVSFLTNTALSTYRRTMLEHCVFRGAALLPNSIFPTVYPQTYAVVLFTRRSGVIAPSTFSPRERSVVNGEYLSLPEAVGAVCGGSWRQGPRGQYLGGTPDFARFAGLWLAPGPDGVDVRPPVEVTQHPESPPEAPPPEQTEINAAVADAVLQLASRVQVWIGKINKDPQVAEDERESIRNAVVECLATNGNPHPKGPAALRAVVTREGGLEPVLTEPVLASTAHDQPPDGADSATLVSYWTERKGYADLADLGEDVDLDAVAQDDRICIDLRSEGAALLPPWAYFTGSPATILANLDKSFANPMLSPAVRARLEAQKMVVLQHWSAPKTLVEIDATPRSPFVSTEILTDWLNTMAVDGGSTGERLYPDAIAEEHGPLTLVVEDTIARIQEGPALDWLVSRRETQLDAVYWLLAYVNRMRDVDSLTEDGKTKDAYGSLDAAGVLEKDRTMVDRFQSWLAESQWVAAVESDYNTKFAPQMISQVPTDAVSIAGQSTGVRLHPHQNQIVRRLSMGGKATPFLWGADVGAGKTFAGTAAALRWRQIGAARRCVVTVPTSVIAKWYDDGKRIFPSARIGLIGITPLGNGKGRSDGPDVRLEKWLRFAAGAYDYVICGHETFERDIEPSVHEVSDVMVQDAWARRGKAKQVSKFRRIQERIEAARKTLAAYQAADSYPTWRRLFSRVSGDWVEHRANQITKVTSEIEKQLRALEKAKEKEGALGTDAQVVSVQEQIIRMCAAKTYRPNAGAPDDDEDEEEEAAADGEGEDFEVDSKKKGKEFTPLPGLVSWGDLGIDALIVDEAHRFKNLRYPQEKVEYAGGGQDVIFGVKKAWDMFIKTRLIHRRAGGVGGVLFLTATPTTNSPLELYSLLDMVNPRCWEDAGIYTKQDFIDRFWDIRTEDVPAPDGSMKPRPALKGFTHGDELAGMIRTTFQRLSIADLVSAGWLRSLPSAEPERLYFQRDVAQIACIRTLVALRVAWTKANSSSEEVKRRTACGLDEMVPLIKWSIDVEKEEVYSVATIDPQDRPDVLENKKYRHLAIGVLSLIWQHLVDKIATSPMLIMRYDAEVREQFPRVLAWMSYQQQLDDYRAQSKDYKQSGKGSPPVKPEKPDVPKPDGVRPSQYLTAYINGTIALALLDELPLAEMRQYYAKKPVVPKIGALARIVAANTNRAIFRAYVPAAQALQVEEFLINQMHGRRLQPYLLVRVEDEAGGTILVSGPSAQAHQAHADLRARGVKAEPVREQGRCGHVVFCEYKELHDQIRDAIVKASNNEIPKSRIAYLPKDRPKRLLVSKGFNGADATSITPAEEPIYDVVIGTSKLMAEGIDLQRRSCAVHHLDLPWDPATLHQRNGRAVRQGNLMGSVDVIYYLTEKSYDSIRFDRIAKKAMWWDALFSGQSYTSNPAADKDSQEAGSLDELILSLVIEDPTVLQQCIESMRQEREVAALAEMQAKAARDWLAINAAFARARSTTDESRRGSAFTLAARKLESFKIAYKPIIDQDKWELYATVAQRPIAVDWKQGGVVYGGLVYGDGVRVLDVQVRPKDFLVELRGRGSAQVSTRLASSVYGFQPGENWTYADERTDLVTRLTRANKRLYWFSFLPADLWEYAVDLWDGSTQQLLLRGDTSWFEWSADVPILVTHEDQVVVLDNIALTVPPRELDLGAPMRALQGKIKRVLPLRHPDARGVWLAALRADRVLALPRTFMGSSLYPKYHLPVAIARAPLPLWTTFHRRLFGSTGNVSEVLRQRALLTNEPKDKPKPVDD